MKTACRVQCETGENPAHDVTLRAKGANVSRYGVGTDVNANAHSAQTSTTGAEPEKSAKKVAA